MSSNPNRSSSMPHPMFYFAYGSNMHVHQMAQRSPSSLLKGVGRLCGWRWQINERGVANIVKSSDDYVEGVVYRIDYNDKRLLDRNEGVSKGFYNDKYLDIHFTPSREFCDRKTFYVAGKLEKIATPGTPMDINQGTAAAVSPSRLTDNADPSFTQILGHRVQQQTQLLSQDPISGKAVPAAAACQALEYGDADSLEILNALVYVSTYDTDGLIRYEYIARMEKAIIDGRKLNLSDHFLRRVDQCIHREQRPSSGPQSDYDPSLLYQQDSTSRASDQPSSVTSVFVLVTESVAPRSMAAPPPLTTTWACHKCHNLHRDPEKSCLRCRHRRCDDCHRGELGTRVERSGAGGLEEVERTGDVHPTHHRQMEASRHDKRPRKRSSPSDP